MFVHHSKKVPSENEMDDTLGNPSYEYLIAFMQEHIRPLSRALSTRSLTCAP